MENKNKLYDVTNRSGGSIVYMIPEENIRRTFAIGETKKISYGELEKLSWQPGGKTLMLEYLMIREPEALEELQMNVEPEYYMTEKQVIELLENGSYDSFLDCLDFAPDGVLQMVKDYAVKLKLNDVKKRKAIYDKLGYDVNAAIEFVEQEQKQEKEDSKSTPTRRIQNKPAEAPALEAVSAAPVRRTDGSKYKVVSTAK